MKKVPLVLLSVLLTLAVLSLVVRFALPQIDFYKKDVAQHLSAMLNQTVQIGQIHASLAAYAPLVKVSDLQFGAANDPDYVQISELGVVINLWQSLWQRQLSIRSIQIRDSQFGLVRTRQGKIRPHPILAAMLQQEAGDGKQSIEVLFSNVQFHFEDQKHDWRGTTHIEQLVLQQDGESYRFGGRAQLPQTLGQRIEFSANIQGVLSQLDTLQGEFYLLGEKMQTGKFLQLAELPAPVSGQVDVRVWGEFEDLTTGWVSGEFACLACRFDEENFEIKTRVYAKNDARGWHFEMAETDLAASQGKFERISVGLRKQAAEPFMDTVLIAPNFSGQLLEKIKQFPQLADLVEDIDFKVDSGTLKLAMRTPMAVHALPNQAMLKQLGEQLQAVQLVKAEIELQEGFVVVDKKKQSFDRVQVQLRGVHRQEEMVLAVDALEFVDGDAELHAQLAGYREAAGTPHAMFVARLKNVEVRDLMSWMPQSLEMPRPVKQIKRTLLGGEIADAQIHWSGFVSEQAFADSGSVLRVDAAVADVRVQYSPESDTAIKPLLVKDMNIHIADNQLLVKIPSVYYKDYRLQNLMLGIDDLSRPYLTVQGQGSGSVDDLMHAAQEAQMIIQGDQDWLVGLDVAGKVSFTVKAGIPLSERVTKNIDVDGEVKVVEGSVYWPDMGLRLDRINSTIQLDKHSARAETLTARLNRKYSIDGRLSTEQDKLRMQLTGKIPVSLFAENIPPEWRQRITGSSVWKLRLQLPAMQRLSEGFGDVSLQLSSDLKGMSVDLPAPFQKSAPDSKQLLLDVGISSSQQLRFRYDGFVDGKLVVGKTPQGKNQLQALQVHFGKAPRLSDLPAFALTGHIQQSIAIEEWEKLFQTSTSGRAGSRTKDKVAILPLRVVLRFDDLTYGDNDFNAVSLDANIRSAQRWQARIDSELLKGKLSSEPGKDRMFLTAHMDSIVLPDDKPFAGSQDQDAAARRLRPSDLPVLELTAKKIRYGHFSCRNLRLVSDYTKYSWILSNMSCQESGVSATFKGEWFYDGRAENTRVEFNMKGRDYGKLMRNWKLSNQMRGGKGTIAGKMHWSGAPADFETEKAVGTVRVDLEDGVIQHDSAGLGITHLFGLLNLGNVVRHLSTDFGNLFQQGLGVDKLTALFQLKKRNMFTELSVTGPALALNMKGRVGITARDYDQTMEVIPNFRSSLPVTAGFLGGPIAGVAVFLADKLTRLGDRLDEIYALNYRITGSWDSPVITLIGSEEKKSGKAQKDQGKEKGIPKLLGNTVDWFEKQIKKGKSVVLPEKK